MRGRIGLLGTLAKLLAAVPRRRAGGLAAQTPAPHQGSDPAATVEVTPPAADELRISYAPDRDGAPDAGEIVWTWVPYSENDGRGKDRPVLVIGRQDADRVYAVRLTSRSQDGDGDFVGIGVGPWDARGRPSWVDLERLYSVHTHGMRREAAALDRERFGRVGQALRRRYGWAVEDV